jgi:hypothetical protein
MVPCQSSTIELRNADPLEVNASDGKTLPGKFRPEFTILLPRRWHPKIPITS